ncbi:MAG: hypothetical protein QOE68_1183 [Thermoanaerobaculia bacterium]|jgi:hypothetical protein|nr:hypothetical protein [Thermoanaerobaculia bacterium]
MRFIAIVAMAVFAGIVYGILHDQVTARVCIEYFTIGHPPLIASRSPTLLALAWGVVATWWFALPLGVALASSARLGEQPRLAASQLVKPVVFLLAAMGAAAFLSGMIGYVLAARHSLVPDEWLLLNIPSAKRYAFIADSWAHAASYLAAFFGAIILCLYVRHWRRRLTPAG